MNFKNLLICFFLIQLSYGNAQDGNDVLFTVDGEAVRTNEFLRVFKKNRDIVAAENRKSVEEYLDLYVNYKLKLKQAYQLKYDTVRSYRDELSKYREQLTAPYLTDSKITRSLVKEAYERTKKEVNASHILTMVAPGASPADTLKAYQKIIKARDRILKGDDFESVAKSVSEDPSAKQSGGNLGYFSAFSMVYSFENVAYQTKLNDVSMPFRTRFGYHIVKVNDIRDSKGEVQVAHIMIKNNPADSLEAKTKIDELHAKLLQNGNFEMLAKQHSEDRNSSINGGILPKFNANRMIKEFADVAFSLEKEQEISKPFLTPYGWHIAKLIKKYPVDDFNDMKEELTQKIEKSERAKMAGKSIVNKLIDTYKITKDDKITALFLKEDTKAIERNLGNMIFSINSEKTNLKDLMAYKNAHPNKSSKAVYNDFFETQVLTHYKQNLDKTNPEFAYTLQEYKDGLLLFDILQDKVWKRAENDTLALGIFFKKNQADYFWPKRAEVIIASSSSKEKAEQIQKRLRENKTIDQIKEAVNEGAIIHVIFAKGTLEEGHKKLPANFIFEKLGVSPIYNEGDANFIIVKVLKILEPEAKKLKEAKGRVINDFQEALEVQWIAELKQQYAVEINKKILKKLIKQEGN